MKKTCPYCGSQRLFKSTPTRNKCRSCNFSWYCPPIVINDNGEAAQEREEKRLLVEGYRAAAEALRNDHADELPFHIHQVSPWSFALAADYLEQLAKELKQ